MAARLPIVGGDNDDWGTILNSFLKVSHNDDGTLNLAAVTAAKVGALPDTADLSAIAGANPTVTSWSNNAKQITNIANGSSPQDAAAFGQIPYAGGTNFLAVNFGMNNASAGTTANTLYLSTVQMPIACTLTGLAVNNGATVAGSTLVGIYNSAGTSLLASSAATAQTGTYQAQFIPFSSAYAITPGTYLFAVMPSSSSATFAVCATLAPGSKAVQGSFALPSSVTPPAAGVPLNNVMCGSY